MARQATKKETRLWGKKEEHLWVRETNNHKKENWWVLLLGKAIRVALGQF